MGVPEEKMERVLVQYEDTKAYKWLHDRGLLTSDWAMDSMELGIKLIRDLMKLIGEPLNGRERNYWD